MLILLVVHVLTGTPKGLQKSQPQGLACSGSGACCVADCNADPQMIIAPLYPLHDLAWSDAAQINLSLCAYAIVTEITAETAKTLHGEFKQ